MQLTWPNSTRMLAADHPRGGSCPSECPCSGDCLSVYSSNYAADLRGAMGIRTPDLLHAMNPRPIY